MRSLVKLYDMYKAGEYIRDFSDDKMQYLKVLDRIPEDNRNKLMRLDDKLNKQHSIEIGIAMLLMAVFGLAIGYLITSGYYEITQAINTLAQNTTVIP